MAATEDVVARATSLAASASPVRPAPVAGPTTTRLDKQVAHLVAESGSGGAELTARELVDLDDKCATDSAHACLGWSADHRGRRLCSYQLVQSVLRLLESQEAQARRDLDRLAVLRATALAAPADYLDAVLAGVRARATARPYRDCGPRLTRARSQTAERAPAAQAVPEVPVVDWRAYGGPSRRLRSTHRTASAAGFEAPTAAPRSSLVMPPVDLVTSTSSAAFPRRPPSAFAASTLARVLACLGSSRLTWLDRPVRRCGAAGRQDGAPGTRSAGVPSCASIADHHGRPRALLTAPSAARPGHRASRVAAWAGSIGAPASQGWWRR
jgi:hypothetical protein